MTGQQLRNSILQEAIHGRLVPNVLQPREKTGEELLKSILAERQKKENEEKGKKAKKLTLSTIEEGPWELPEGWSWCNLGDLCITVGNKENQIKATEVKEYGKYPVVSQGQSFVDGYYDDESKIITDIPVIIFGDHTKNVKYIDFPFIVGADGTKVLSPFPQLNAKWFFYTIFYYAKVILYDRGYARHFSLLNKELFPLPPLSIQKAIVEKIEELLPLIDEYDKAAGELETLNKILPDKLRKSVLQEAIHGNLVSNDIPEGEATGAELLQQILKERQEKENKEKGKKAKKLTLSTIEEELWELPEEWCWCKLGDVGSWGAGATPQRGNAVYYQEGTIPWLKTGELNNGVVYDTEEKITELALKQCSLRLCQPNDVLIAMYGATIGKLALAGVPLTTNQACCACTPYTGIYNKYLFFFLLAKKDDFTKQAFGGAQPNISKEKIVGTDFPLPPLSIQHRIVEKIEEVFSAINKLQA